MKKIDKLFLYIINLPIYWFFSLLPKDKNIWVFGSWFGDKYTDNTKYLFEYVNENQPGTRAIWLTRNKDVLNHVRDSGFEAYMTYSFKGYYYSSKAYNSFITVGACDINFFSPPNKIINLWHGNPLKKIGYDDKVTYNYKEPSKFKKTLKNIFKFSKDSSFYSSFIASSNEEADKISSAFAIDVSSVIVSGFPRNDSFSIRNIRNKINTKYSNSFNVIYMPTHRNEGETDISKLFVESINFINDKLKNENIILFIKLHFYHLKDFKHTNYSNVKFLTDDDINSDIYTVLKEFDMLITDYSSIYFDYLLTNRPIIFAPFDFDNYINKDRELYYDYDEVTPGPKCKDWDEVLDWVIKFKENPSLYKEERRLIRDRFHKYQDANSCERVYKKIIEL